MDRLAGVIAEDMKKDHDAETVEKKTGNLKRYVCRICGYVYEGEELPADFICPLCGADASYFDEREKPKHFACSKCGFIYEGAAVPEEFCCPICDSPSDQFVLQEE